MSSDMGATPQLPAAIGRYKILAQLASSSPADVYRGFDPMIERPVVVKLFHLPESDAAASIKHTFYREMQRVGALMHEGIAALFDAGEMPGALFMASEFIEGSSLVDLIKAGFDVELPMRVSVITQIVDALEYARANDVAHLSLRGTNVLIGTDYALKIGGFGIAPVIDELATATGVRLAPTRFTAPERLNGGTGDFRSDVFSLAKITLEVLVGPNAADESQFPAPPAYLADHNVDASQWTTLFTRALATNPADRFQHAGDFKNELLLLLGVGEAEARLAWEISRAVGTVPAGADSETMLAMSSSQVTRTATAESVPAAHFVTDDDAQTMISQPMEATHTGVTPGDENKNKKKPT